MKTFKGYITEAAPAWTGSLSATLFYLPRAGLTDAKIPLSPSIFKRIWPKSIRSTAFHVTDVDGIAKLKKMQNKKRSISAFYNMDYDMISYGIRTEGGYVVELEGDVLIAAPEDLATAPDKSGRRWITLSTLMNNPDDASPGVGGKAKLKGMESDISEMMMDIIMKYVDDPRFMPDIQKSWIHLRQELESDKKLLSIVIRDYIDGMEKIMKKYSRKLRPLFTDYTKNRTLNVDPDSGDVPQWDELVVNNFIIKKVHVGEVYADDFEGDDDIHGLPFQTWNSDQTLSAHIASIVKKGK